MYSYCCITTTHALNRYSVRLGADTPVSEPKLRTSTSGPTAEAPPKYRVAQCLSTSGRARHGCRRRCDAKTLVT
ncbi:hypothetical protein P167DRAFT_151538 [Morchella conica CCBAS932]|uniref:Uncharacterized protein n=1 Tax=Morchella conica CCBAS932 TaxID=1392247 RepID=A0A3N4KQB6_9PEZI|nr:hypothetical protein P167DRAFT_151538 [Morchella conica CCBAS932]